MKVQIINKSNNPLPSYTHRGDACMDIRASLKEPFVLEALSKAVIPTGLYVNIPIGWMISVRSRSGLAAKKGVFVLNSPGTIDHGYNDENKDEVGIILMNLSNEDFVINPGDRIAQIILEKAPKLIWDEVDTFGNVNSRGGGLGSSGVK